MDIQTAIQAFQLLKGTNGITAAYLPLTDKIAFNELADSAISALQEQAEREKGCAWCRDYNLAVEVQHKVKHDVVLTCGQLNYCPMCGRRLK